MNFLLRYGADVFQVDKVQRRSAIHHATVAGQAGVLRALLSDDQLLHTEDGLLPLKHVRVHDVSGQCRFVSEQPFIQSQLDLITTPAILVSNWHALLPADTLTAGQRTA